MRENLKFYINGAWVNPVSTETMEVINPATEAVAGRIAMGSAADVDRAVKAARGAFADWSSTSIEERVGILERIITEYTKRYNEISDAITEEMGAPTSLSQGVQTGAVIAQFQTTIAALKAFSFVEDRGPTRIVKEPIGVCGLITPWNWPVNQVAVKVAPAIAMGCTMILKPSEVAPFSNQIFAEVMHAAGVPAGVFNLVQGDGPTVGAAMAAHPDIDLVSFTGSTRAGVEVARAAAASVKRVAQELGGKSPNIILDDADLQSAVSLSVMQAMMNSGQSCNAPTRMLVPATRIDEVIAIAKAAAEDVTVGDPRGDAQLGPVVSETQWSKIQRLIDTGVAEGATLVAGGPGRPDELTTGYYVKPTVFAHVTNDMTIAREEIFGPVLSILEYDTVDQAVAIANDTPYGLSAYVWGSDLARVHDVASKMRAGQVLLNGADFDLMAPFGGYKMSGNGREWGDHAFAEFLEVKAIMGFRPPDASGSL
jgi:aldehyde dehydrogenase (NAD+)